MADFRKNALAFAGLACFFGLTSTASAQFGNGFNCTANAAVPIDERAEGITEQAGDVVVNCTGGIPTASGLPVPQVNITITTNTQITSRVLGGPAGTPNVEAAIMINEPQPGPQQVYCPGTPPGTVFNPCNQLLGVPATIPGQPGGGGGAGSLQYRTPGVSNVFGGVLVSSNQVTFFGVPIDPPGPGAAGSGNVPTLTLRIIDVRVNASSLGAPTGFAVTNVFENISTSAGFAIQGATQTVGSVRRGLVNVAVNGTNGAGTIASTGAPGTLQQCTTFPASFAGGAGGVVEFVSFSEGFATATKFGPPQIAANPAIFGVPGATQNTEYQTVVPAGALGTLGLADFGTRVKITFNNIQAGVSIFVPTTINSTTLAGTPAAPSTTMQLTSSETGAFSPVGPSTSPSNLRAGFAQLTLTNGSGVAVYQVSSQNIAAPTLVETFTVPVIVSYTASPGTNSPSLGTSTVNVDFAPTSTVTTASTGPIPRFVPSSTAINGFAINSCATNLLYPFVTNIAGFDTGLAISDTSTDPFGTAAQNGTCTLNFYGSNAPSAFTTPNINSGTVYTTLASTVAAGFQGYMIAVCKFQYAHGFAFVTDGFGGPGRGLSQGYLPLVIPDPSVLGGRGANPIGLLTAGTGEQITN